MIVNGFSVVAAFAAVLRAWLGILAIVAGARAFRAAWREPTGAVGEERLHLALVLCATLAGLSVVSWPLLYLVLESYVPGNGGPQWPGVMCIEGVLRVGTGSVGAASFLPGLLRVLGFTKPLLVFLSGAWLVLHLMNRRGRTDALRMRVLAALTATGLLAVVDGAVETAYLAIPKEERFLAAGCCGAVGVPEAPPDRHVAVAAAFFSLGAAQILAVTAALRRGGRWLALALALAIVSLPLGVAFLADVAAPGFLHLPYHHCPYCLVKRMPETLVGIGLYVAGAFGVGWALLAGKSGGTGEGLLRMARFGYLGALAMAGVMLVSA